MRYDARTKYVRLARIVVLVNLSRAQEGVRFVVPDVEPGTYPVAIYDGAEEGGHYTWDLFTVTEPDPASRAWTWIVPLLVVGFVGVILIARRAIQLPVGGRRDRRGCGLCPRPPTNARRQ